MMTFFHSLMDRRPHSSLRTSTASEGRTARTTRLQRDRHGSTAASLEARRSNARLHRFLAALCAGLTVFATLQCVRAAIATQPIVVAVRNVAKGTAITREDVELREAPSDGSLSNAFHTLDDAVGLIAQVGIGAHDVLMSGMARASPVVPQGHTSIEVRLASVAGGLIPGDKVTLSSATMTDAEMQSGTPNVQRVRLFGRRVAAVRTARRVGRRRAAVTFRDAAQRRATAAGRYGADDLRRR